MDVLQVLDSKIDLARQVIADLVRDYEQLTDYQRLEKANIIFDCIYSYLRIKKNLFVPFIRESGLYDDLVDRSYELDSDIERIIELSTMMHVDEPSFEFYNNMVTLQNLMNQLRDVDHSSIFSWAHVYLTPEQATHIQLNLKNQMSHEGMPIAGPPYR